MKHSGSCLSKFHATSQIQKKKNCDDVQKKYIQVARDKIYVLNYQLIFFFLII
jgi:hypothetical protein